MVLKIPAGQVKKKQKRVFGMVFVIPGGVLGIRCNLESSSFEPPGSLYIYRDVYGLMMAVVVIIMCRL